VRRQSRCRVRIGFGHAPRGADSLTGHRKLEACLKCGPTVKISWIRSSTQMMPYLPSTWGRSGRASQGKRPGSSMSATGAATRIEGHKLVQLPLTRDGSCTFASRLHSRHY